MQRIHAPFDEPTLAQIDREVKRKHSSRAQWLNSAIGAYLRLLELTKGADPAQMMQEAAQSAPEVAQMRLTIKSLQSENQSLKEEVQRLKSEGKDAAQIAPEMAQLKTTIESQWRDNQKLKKAEESAREEAEQARRKLGAIEAQIAANTLELEKARSDMILLEHDKAHFQDTINQKNQQISFLEAHIAQLTQSISQFALKPGEEEIKAKHWYQFWK
jgi:chromosome segregation ATPase